METDPKAIADELLMPRSINEPPGSDIGTGDAGPAELPPLVLSAIDPDSLTVGTGEFMLTVTGSGFIPSCVVMVNDAAVPTTFVSPTSLTAMVPAQETAGTVDVEVQRGEDYSDVLQFEFTAPAGQAALPSDSELNAMTRAQLDALAAERGLDSTSLATKADVIAYLKANA